MEVERLASAELRQHRRREATVTWRDPALVHLRAASTAPGVVPECVQALIAFYEGRRQEATTLARSAFAAAGWLYEAKVLKRRILTELASDGWWDGR